jgi:hypothetical protein
MPLKRTKVKINGRKLQNTHQWSFNFLFPSIQWAQTTKNQHKHTK